MTTISAVIDNKYGEGSYDSRELLFVNKPPVNEMFRVGNDIWWSREFRGETYGSYVKLSPDEEWGEDMLEIRDMLLEQACDTLDAIASKSISDPRGTLPIGDLFCLDGDKWAEMRVELCQLDSPPRVIDANGDLGEIDFSPEMMKDSYWLNRAKRRKEIMAEFGVTWEQIEALQNGETTCKEIRSE